MEECQRVENEAHRTNVTDAVSDETVAWIDELTRTKRSELTL